MSEQARQIEWEKGWRFMNYKLAFEAEKRDKVGWHRTAATTITMLTSTMLMAYGCP